jgi:hypothetical protein
MDAFADMFNVYKLQAAKIGFGGDVTLKPGTERFAEQEPKGTQQQRHRQ